MCAEIRTSFSWEVLSADQKAAVSPTTRNASRGALSPYFVRGNARISICPFFEKHGSYHDIDCTYRLGQLGVAYAGKLAVYNRQSNRLYLGGPWASFHTLGTFCRCVSWDRELEVVTKSIWFFFPASENRPRPFLIVKMEAKK